MPYMSHMCAINRVQQAAVKTWQEGPRGTGMKGIQVTEIPLRINLY